MQSGTIVDAKYEIVRSLGAGGFGAVYEALQLQFSRSVAVKILSASVLHEVDGLARFEREAKAVSALRHKNIVSFLGFGVYEHAPYMVMELVQGRSLQSIIGDEKRIEPRRALLLFRQVFEALYSAHSAGVVHRDLKPSNIMVYDDATGGEAIKIIDFGLAKLMPGYGLPAQKLTETGYAIGTCHYMAPEQALGKAVDHRVDIYAAGCILYQVVTGQLPFDAEENIAVLFQHLNVHPEPISTFADFPSPLHALQSIIDRCIAKEPDDRYQRADEVVKDIDAILHNRVDDLPKFTADVPPPLSLSGKKLSAKTSMLLLIAVCAILAAATGTLLYVTESTRRAESLAAQERERTALLSRCQNDKVNDPEYREVFRLWESGACKDLPLADRLGILHCLLLGPANFMELKPPLPWRPEDYVRFAREYLKEVNGLPLEAQKSKPHSSGIRAARHRVNSHAICHGLPLTGPPLESLLAYCDLAEIAVMPDRKRSLTEDTIKFWMKSGQSKDENAFGLIYGMMLRSAQEDRFIEFCEKALVVGPPTDYVRVACYQQLARLYGVKNQPELALKAARSYCRLEPKSIDAQLSLADSYFAAGQYDQARAIYKRCLTSQAEFYHAASACGLARLAAAQGAWKELGQLSVEAENLLRQRAGSQRRLPIGMRALRIESAYRLGDQVQVDALRQEFDDFARHSRLQSDISLITDARLAPHALRWGELQSWFPGGSDYKKAYSK